MSVNVVPLNKVEFAFPLILKFLEGITLNSIRLNLGEDGLPEWPVLTFGVCRCALWTGIGQWRPTPS